MNDTNITQILLASLRRQASRFPAEARDIEIAIAALELPRAYTLMSRLKERGAWRLTTEEEAALDDFWWEYGQ
jgi:hypothetical protein